MLQMQVTSTNGALFRFLHCHSVVGWKKSAVVAVSLLMSYISHTFIGLPTVLYQYFRYLPTSRFDAIQVLLCHILSVGLELCYLMFTPTGGVRANVAISYFGLPATVISHCGEFCPPPMLCTLLSIPGFQSHQLHRIAAPSPAFLVQNNSSRHCLPLTTIPAHT
jgi:hypothetical protein